MKWSAMSQRASAYMSSWTTRRATKRLVRNWFARRPKWTAALYANIFVVDQSGRTLLRAVCQAADQVRRPQVGQRADRSHRGVHLAAQRQPAQSPPKQKRTKVGTTRSNHAREPPNPLIRTHP